MKRIRLIVREIGISRQSEVKNFQVKLPKNVTRVIAVETDARIDTKLTVSGTTGPDGTSHPMGGDASGGGGIIKPVRGEGGTL